MDAHARVQSNNRGLKWHAPGVVHGHAKETVLLLLETKADPNLLHGHPLLALAARAGDEDLMRILSEHASLHACTRTL